MLLPFPRRRRPFLFSASEAPRLALCIGALWLPQSPAVWPETSHGTMVHHYLHRAKVVGKDLALAEQAEFLGWTGSHDADGEPLYEDLDRGTEELLDVLAAIPVERLPEGLEPEVSFAWTLRTDEARILGSGLGRDYEREGALGPDWIVGTADLAGERHGEVLVLPDYKTGIMRQRARASWQLKTLFLLASKATGIRRAEVANVYVGRRGGLYPDGAEFGPADLDEAETMARAIPKRLDEARAQLADGELPALAVGEQCRYCPSVVHCPAHTTEVVRGFLHPVNLGRLAQRLPECTAEEKKAAVVTLGLAKRHIKRLEGALKRQADEEPIALDGGMQWCAVRTDREVFTAEGEAQLEALKARLRAQGEVEGTTVWRYQATAAPLEAPEPPTFGPPDEDEGDEA